MITFKHYLEDSRIKMCRVASKYNVKEHNELRTEIDSFLIAYDQVCAEYTKNEKGDMDVLK